MAKLRPTGVPEIVVTLEYDKSGIVHVHAREAESGKELNAKIEYAALMSGAEIQQAKSRVAGAKVKLPWPMIFSSTTLRPLAWTRQTAGRKTIK